MPAQTDELLAYLFDGQPHPLAQPMAAWLASSRRFAAFAAAFRDKIRKKLRTTQSQQGLLDLQLELQTAYLLLQERALSVAYEPEQSKGIRSPDFAVTFTTSFTFMLEVTRVQADVKDTARASRQPAPTPPGITSAAPPSHTRLTDAVLNKLGQLLARRGNVLLIAIEAPRLTPDDIRIVMLSLQQRVERNDSTVLQAYGFPDRAAFFRQFLRLSEILVRAPQEDAAEAMLSWVNPQAKHPLPGRVRTVLHRSLAA